MRGWSLSGSAIIGALGCVTLAAACGGVKGAAPEPGAAPTPAARAAKGTPARAALPPPKPAMTLSAKACQRTLGDVGLVRHPGARQSSAVALGRDAKRSYAYVADTDGRALHTMDARRTRATTPLIGEPSQAIVLADGRVVVTLRDKNRLQVLEPAARADLPLRPLCEIPTPIEPIAMAVTPDDQRLLVTSGWGKRLSIFGIHDTKYREVKLAREPRAVLVDDDGKRAFVNHVVGGKLSVIDLEGDQHDLRKIDMRVKQRQRFRRGRDTRESCQGFALAKSVAPLKPEDVAGTREQPLLKGEVKPLPKPRPRPVTPAIQVPKGRIFAPRVTIDPGDPRRRSSGYGSSTFAQVEAPIVTVIDAGAERPLTRALVQHRNHGRRSGECLLPRAAAVSNTTGSLLVTCLGANTLVELEARSVDPARLEKRRWSLPDGPTGLAVDDVFGHAFVWSQFDRKLSVIDLASAKAKKSPTKPGLVPNRVVKAPKLAKHPLTKTERWGRRLFHQTDDDRISRDGRACASCHPDGREDSLTWSTPVGPRQTIMLAGRVKGSAPYSWFGTHKDVKVHLRNTFRRLGGKGLTEHKERTDAMDALVAYLHRMEGPRLTGARVDARRAARIERGKHLFFADAQGCSNCHTGGSGVDRSKHDIGTRAPGDGGSKFDTPSLRFVAGTAPYFHDGRFASLQQLLMTPSSQMGHTMHLSRADALALEAYMGTL